jgi:MoxR-like ATPase
MTQQPEFKPARVQRGDAAGTGAGVGDQRFGDVYVYHHPDIELAVQVALATERPLLVAGPAGSGKSSLARNVAHTLKWRYYELVVTSRTEARDLLYSFDSIRRLNDAQDRNVSPDPAVYVEPGVLWWAISPDTARERGSRAEGGLAEKERLDDPAPRKHERAVVLIDEIDKADVDVPNALLVPLGAFRFRVEPTRREVEATPQAAPLVILTTNGERELPPAFLRRCIVLELPAPDTDRLVEIARAAIPAELVPRGVDAAKRFRELATIVQEHARREGGPNAGVSTAEYLDTVEASLRLGIGPGAPLFDDLLRLTQRKRQYLQEASA